MNEHFFTLPITTCSAVACERVQAFAHELITHGSNAQVIFEAVAADPDCVLAQAYAAALFLTRMTRDGQVQAAPRIAHARIQSHHASLREQQTVEAISAWGRGDDRTAIRHFRSIIEVWPHDIVAAKLCQILELGIGDTRGMVRTSAMAASVEARSGFALGLHAFALEQFDNPELAIRFGRRAIELNPGYDPWAQHAVAHALSALDQPVEGRAFLHAHASDWDRCSSFMLTHNWWHAALLELELGDTGAALRLFDRHVWGVRKGHCQDQLNAISLLARLEMKGVKAGKRWDDIAAHVEDRIGDRISGFLDLHYLYALARAGRDAAADTLAAALANDADHPVCAALAKGLIAHARRQYVDVIAAIGPNLRNTFEVGGSNIQRELFERVTADSLRRVRGFIEPIALQEAHRVAA